MWGPYPRLDLPGVCMLPRVSQCASALATFLEKLRNWARRKSVRAGSASVDPTVGNWEFRDLRWLCLWGT